MVRKMPRTNDPAVNRARMTAFWHPARNGDVLVADIAVASHTEYWWKCQDGGCDDHEWKATPKNLSTVSGHGCPFCSNRRACAHNNAAALRPDLAARWHPTRNEGLTLADVTPGTSRKVWWHCTTSGCGDHEWEEKVDVIARGRGCPFCNGKRTCAHNNTAALRPDLIERWHPTRNGDKTLADYAPGSNKTGWWRCDAACGDHVWEEKIIVIARGGGCPFCRGFRTCSHNHIAKTHPEQARHWHPTRNGSLRALDVTRGSGEKVWWLCRDGCCDHEWEATVASRTAYELGCPYCSGRYACDHTAITATHPHMAALFHPTMNGDLRPQDLLASSDKRVWWTCPERCCEQEHVWDAPTHSRRVAGCPWCAGIRTCRCRSMGENYPDLLNEWDAERNPDRDPFALAPAASYKAAWLCPNGHRYEALVSSRTGQGTGCSRCTIGNTSRTEIRLRHEVGSVLDTPVIDAIRVGEGRGAFWLDLAMPELKTVVEFDGARWHNTAHVEDRDQRKNAALIEAGWRVVRVREKPLEKIGPDDLLVYASMPPKALANRVLEHLHALGGFPFRIPLATYLAERSCVAKEAADAEIARRTVPKKSKAEAA